MMHVMHKQGTSSQLCSTVLDVISSLYHQDAANYFILEPQNTMSQFAEKIYMKPPDLQVSVSDMFLDFMVCQVIDVAWYLACRTSDREVTGSTPVWYTARWQPWASRSHTCASFMFTKQYNLVLAKGRWCFAAWEGNHRCGVALAMLHGLGDLFTYGISSQHLGHE